MEATALNLEGKKREESEMEKREANNPAGGGMDLLSLFLNAVLSG